MAVNMVVHQYYKSEQPTVELRLREDIALANRAVREQFDHGKNATTIVAAVFHQKDLVVAHAGDSRAYWVTRKDIHQITRDHIVKVHASDGTIKERLNEAIGHRHEIKPDVTRINAALYGNLLLVTDGVTTYLTDKDLKRIVNAYEPAAAIQEIITRANDAGGVDNISAVVVNVMGGGTDFSVAAQHATAINRDIPVISDNKQSDAFVLMKQKQRTMEVKTLNLAGQRAVQRVEVNTEWVGAVLVGLLATAIVIGLIFAIIFAVTHIF
jgi:serine/threonine protein phosphatase PrpC